MAQVYPHDFSIEYSANYWCDEGSHSEHIPSHNQQDDDDSSQPCDPGDEESHDEPESDDGFGAGRGRSRSYDPPEDAGELGGDEDTPQW